MATTEDVIATMWCGVRRLGRVEPTKPTPPQEALDIQAGMLAAANCGVRPHVRVVERMPSLVPWVEPGIVCEDDCAPSRPAMPPRRW